MTRRTTQRRLGVVQHAIDSRPIALHALDDLYERFLQKGDLPLEDRFAWAVLDRALRARRGCKPTRCPGGDITAAPPREQVFREATHSFEPIRNAARLVIRALVRTGLDPSDPEFVPSDCELPAFGSAAMHIIGWPDQWVHPSYEGQMQRVMEQHAGILEDGPRSNLWFQDAAVALAGFLREGTMPEAKDLRLFVLTVGEMLALQMHLFGHGDEELVAAFEDVATTTGSQRDAALARLGELQARATREHR